LHYKEYIHNKYIHNLHYDIIKGYL